MGARCRLDLSSAIIAIGWLGAGCPGGIQAYFPCDADSTIACSCAGGQTGVAACSEDGRLSTCQCGDAGVVDEGADLDAEPGDGLLDGDLAADARADTPAEADLAADARPDAPPPGRVTDGLVSLYTFSEGAGQTVGDSAVGGTPVPLTIADLAAVDWLPEGGLRLRTETILSSNGAATEIYNPIVGAGELTIETWIIPAIAAATGPGRVATMAGDGESVDFLLGHGSSVPAGRDQYQARIRTSLTTLGGWPAIFTPLGTARAELTHLVLTRRTDGVETLYVDGVQRAQGTVGGDLSSWDGSYTFSLGNDPDGGDPFLGVYRLVAVYDRALSADEVVQNFAAGPG